MNCNQPTPKVVFGGDGFNVTVPASWYNLR